MFGVSRIYRLFLRAWEIQKRIVLLLVASAVLFVCIIVIIVYMHIHANKTQDDDYLSINGHQKLKKQVNLKIVNFKKEIGIKRHTQFTTVTLIIKKYLNKMNR